MTRPSRVEPVVASARSRACQLRPVTSRTSCSRLLASSSGANMRKSSGLQRVTSRSQPPSTRVASCCVAPGAGDVDARSRRQSGRRRSRSRAPPLATGLALIRRSPVGDEAAQLGDRPARRRRTAPRAGRTAATPRAPPGARRRRGRAGSGTWWARNVPSTCWPSTTGGHGPALRRAQHDHRPAPARRGALVAGARPRPGSSAMSSRQRVDGGGHRLVHRGRARRPRRCAARSRSRAAGATSVGLGDPGQHRRVGDLVAR